MTLGLWVRDYLYIPMGGNRSGEFGKMRNLFLSMLLIGLWHGAGWNFVLWGGAHGILLMINHQWRRFNAHLPNFVNWGLTFLCVTICWVLFRAESFHEAMGVLSAMADVRNITLPKQIETYAGSLQGWGITFVPWGMQASLKKVGLSIATLFLGLLLLPNPLVFMKRFFSMNRKWSVAVALGLVLGVLHIADNSPFLYFQF